MCSSDLDVDMMVVCKKAFAARKKAKHDVAMNVMDRSDIASSLAEL